MASRCFKLLRFLRVRVEQLAADGSPVAGAGNLFVADTQVSLAIGYNNRAGDDFEQINGAGDICFAFLEPDQYKNLTLSLVMCDHNPEFMELLLGGDLISDGGVNIGYALPEVGTAGNENGVALTGWTHNISGSGVDSEYQYVKHLFPKTAWTPADKTFENNPITNAFTGVGYENAQYFDGGQNDWSGVSDRLWQFQGTNSIPDASCNAGSLLAS